jgi:RNA polymerase sigma-32 factor
MGRTDATFFERECARIIVEGPLSEADEQRLVTRWRDHGDRRAAHALVRAHLPVVLQLARRYRGYGVARDELVAEGNVGLLRAVEKFELRGVRFKTYATYWVRAQMLAYVLRSGSHVTRATGAVGAKFFFKLRAARAKAEAQLGPGHEDIDALLARQFGVSVEQVRAHTARLAQGTDVSLDAPVGADGESTALDLLASDFLGPEDTAQAAQRDQQVHEVLRRAWASLDERERAIIDLRLRADEAATLGELGAKFGLSRERLRQIEVQVCERLRRSLTAAGVEA